MWHGHRWRGSQSSKTSGLARVYLSQLLWTLQFRIDLVVWSRSWLLRIYSAWPKIVFQWWTLFLIKAKTTYYDCIERKWFRTKGKCSTLWVLSSWSIVLKPQVHDWSFWIVLKSSKHQIICVHGNLSTILRESIPSNICYLIIESSTLAEIFVQEF